MVEAKIVCRTLGHFAFLKVLTIQLSLAAAERVFSLLNSGLGNLQENSFKENSFKEILFKQSC